LFLRKQCGILNTFSIALSNSCCTRTSVFPLQPLQYTPVYPSPLCSLHHCDNVSCNALKLLLAASTIVSLSGAAFTPVKTYLQPLPLSPSVAQPLRLWKLICSLYYFVSLSGAAFTPVETYLQPLLFRLPQWRRLYACGNLFAASTFSSPSVSQSLRMWKLT
jgi:hypothetical protein